jgi:hypothetical protein
MTLLERKGGSVGRKEVYVVNRRNGKKLIPAGGKCPGHVKSAGGLPPASGFGEMGRRGVRCHPLK